MKWHIALAAATGLAALTATPVSAQVTTQELFHVKFRATCKPSNDDNGQRTRMRDHDLIELCVGSGFSQRDLRRNFALVYSPATDSIQVADARTGAVLCDVFQFQGGTIVTNNNRLERLTFVFIPTDDTAVGSAVITERTIGFNNNNPRARINGRLQFTVPDGVNWITNHSLVNGTATVLAANANTQLQRTDKNKNAGNVNGDDNSNGDDNGDNGQGGSDLNGTDNGRGALGDNNPDDQNSGNGASLGPFVQAAAAADTVTIENAQICTGTFTVGRAFEPGVPGRGGNDDDDDDDDLDDINGANGDNGDDVINGDDNNGGIIDETPANGGTNDDDANDTLNGDDRNRNGVNTNRNGNGVAPPPVP